MKKIFFLSAIMMLMVSASFAQQTSSINPNVPAPGADVDSYTIRTLALSAYNDINTLFQDHNLPSIGANQVLGSLTAGVPSGQTIPPCSGSTNALSYTQGVGFGCNFINPSGTGSVTSVGLVMPSLLFVSPVSGSPITTSGVFNPLLANQNANTFFAGPTSGVASQPTMRNLVQTDFPPLGANQILGALTATTPSGISLPSCSGANQALNWTAATGFGCVTIAGGGGAPSGPAGGDLGGTYPNPTVISVADVTTGHLPNVNLSPLGANQILGAVTSTTPSGLSIPSCSGASSALTFTVGSGFGCNSISASGNVNSSTSGFFGYYASSGSTISGVIPGNTISIQSSGVNTTQPSDRNVSLPTDTITSADCGIDVIYNNASSVSVSIAAASSSGLTQGCAFIANNIGAANVTITPNISTINGASSLIIPPGTGCAVRSDSTNYKVDYSACTALTLPAGNLATTPADNATCTAGQMWFDAGFIYICTASGTVKRATLATF